MSLAPYRALWVCPDCHAAAPAAGGTLPPVRPARGCPWSAFTLLQGESGEVSHRADDFRPFSYAPCDGCGGIAGERHAYVTLAAGWVFPPVPPGAAPPAVPPASTRTVVDDAREWIRGTFRTRDGLDPYPAERLTTGQVLAGIDRHYIGGLPQFLADGNIWQ